MAKKRDMSYHKYFTKVELAKEFGYRSNNSFISGKAHGDMWNGILFIIDRVERVKDMEIEKLKSELNKLIK